MSSSVPLIVQVSVALHVFVTDAPLSREQEPCPRLWPCNFGYSLTIVPLEGVLRGAKEGERCALKGRRQERAFGEPYLAFSSRAERPISFLSCWVCAL